MESVVVGVEQLVHTKQTLPSHVVPSPLLTKLKLISKHNPFIDGQASGGVGPSP